MASTITIPDVEGLLITGLNAAMVARSDAARWSTRIPATRPSRFGRVRRRGGPVLQTVLDNPLILIEAWDTDETKAFALASIACGVIAAMPDGSPITEAQILSGPSNDPDPDTTTPRYTCVAQLWVNAA